MKFFVTGGAGFIGSCFVRLLLNENPHSHVVNFDALTYAGNPDNLTGLDESRHRFVCGNIADAKSVLANLDQDTDVIVNFAAESHVDRSIASADEFLRTNIVGTQVLLDAARARGVNRGAALIFGTIPIVMVRSIIAATEDSSAWSTWMAMALLPCSEHRRTVSSAPSALL